MPVRKKNHSHRRKRWVLTSCQISSKFDIACRGEVKICIKQSETTAAIWHVDRLVRKEHTRRGSGPHYLSKSFCQLQRRSRTRFSQAEAMTTIFVDGWAPKQKQTYQTRWILASCQSSSKRYLFYTCQVYSPIGNLKMSNLVNAKKRFSILCQTHHFTLM